MTENFKKVQWFWEAILWQSLVSDLKKKKQQQPRPPVGALRLFCIYGIFH